MAAIADVITVIMQQRESGKDIAVSGDRVKVCEPYDSPFWFGQSDVSGSKNKLLDEYAETHTVAKRDFRSGVEETANEIDGYLERILERRSHAEQMEGEINRQRSERS